MIKVGVIGTGNMGRHHVRVYSELEGAELVGICDLDGERAKGLADKYGAKAFLDYTELLREVDAVTVAVPTKSHFRVVSDCLNSGVNVLVEKPIADKVEDAEALIRLSEEKGVVLQVGHIERFNPIVPKLKEIIESGKLGRLIFLSAERVGPIIPPNADTGVILDLATHDIDVFRYITGKGVQDVFAKKAQERGGIECCASILLGFEEGIVGNIITNWLTPHKLRRLTIIGEKAVAYADYIGQTVEVKDKEGSEDIEIEKQEPLKIELEAFLKSIETKKDIGVSGQEGLANLRIALRAFESSSEGRKMSLD